MKDDRDLTSPARPAVRRRSQGQIVVARALWYVKPGEAELRNERLGPPQNGEARVSTHFSAISRGTERLVFHGEVPESEWSRMRAPLQAGSFPFPLKYGYSAVGTVTAGDDALVGRRVFALHPHQDHFQVAEALLAPVPDSVSDQRATLAANMETALNAHWDAQVTAGDKVLVIGGGVLGLLVAFLARRIPGVSVAVVDIDQERATAAAKLGIQFALPCNAPNENRVVFHTSATSAGLGLAIETAAFEARIIELSWYGARPVNVHLGGAFHSRRLQLISSQVGHVAPTRRASTTPRARLETALTLLDDPALDVLVSDEVAFDDVAADLPRIFSAAVSGFAPLIRYPR